MATKSKKAARSTPAQPVSVVTGGAGFLGLPNAVLLMALLYGVAHLVMSRTVLGRYLYAVGGNRLAARYSGVPVRRVLLVSYAVSGLLAGVGGVVLASQLKSGSPTFGQMYELYVIAAVVVGGAALTGGKGTVRGTLLGAFVIGFLSDGLVIIGVSSYWQTVFTGAVIVLAVLLPIIQLNTWVR